MFGFDMFVHGVHGDELPDDVMLNEEELEVYGVDWEALHDDTLLQSQRNNNSGDEEWTSWVGRTGPPPRLSEVSVNAPSGPSFQQHQLELFDQTLVPWMHGGEPADVITLWMHGLGHARAMYNEF